MDQTFLLLTGLLVGAVVGAALASLLVWVRLSRRAAQAERQLSALEATTAELRSRLEAAGSEEEALRARLAEEQASRVAAETRAAEMLRSVEEQRRLLEEARKQLEDTFQALAAKALQASKEDFLQLAAESLGKREEAIKGLVAPVQETLKRYEEGIRELEKSRAGAYEGLQQQIRNLSRTEEALQRETRHLAEAMRNPVMRGRWGEVTLRRVVELAGMTEHCDFTEQVSVQGEEARRRPDLIVHLPGERRIAVDAKVPLDDYLRAVAEASEDRRQQALREHAQKLRSHSRVLATREYWEALGEGIELVVLFVPGEAFLSAALQADPALFEEALDRKVLLCSPTNLIALLRAVAYGWRQEHVARNAREVSELGKELHDRVRTFAAHMARLGGALDSAVGAFDRAVGSLESRVLPSARRFQDLGAAGGEEVPELKRVGRSPRAVTSGAEEPAGELPGASADAE
jgi:DNA recombination protein RmuC